MHSNNLQMGEHETRIAEQNLLATAGNGGTQNIGTKAGRLGPPSLPSGESWKAGYVHRFVSAMPTWLPDLLRPNTVQRKEIVCMKIWRTLRKRGLALFLAMTMCLTLLPAQALAAEWHEHNQGPWTCEKTDALSCGEHQHDESCEQLQSTLLCGEEDHQHGVDCYAQETVLACGVESSHIHTDDCYVWSCQKAEMPADEESLPPESLEGALFGEAIDPAALVEANYGMEGFLTLYKFFTLVSQSGWMDGTLPYGAFVPALELMGEWETFHLDFDPEAMQDDWSTPVELTAAAVYYYGQAVTVYAAGEAEALPEEMNPETLWITGNMNPAVGQDTILNSGKGAGYQHRWSSDRGAVASVTSSDGQTATVTAYRAGTANITHEWGNYDGSGNWRKAGYETEQVTVTGSGTAYGKVSFNVYYIYDNQVPDTPHAPGNANAYGPGGDNTPLTAITVDIDALLQKYPEQNPDDLVGSDGNYWYITYQTCGHNASTIGEWWSNVLDCAEGAKDKLDETGIGKGFQGYVLKLQSAGGHCDGTLTQEPPVYTVELYWEGRLYQVLVADGDSANENSITMDQVKEAYTNATGGVPGSFHWDKMLYEDAEGSFYHFYEDKNDPEANSIHLPSITYRQLAASGKDLPYYIATFHLWKGESVTPIYEPANITVNKLGEKNQPLDGASFGLYSDADCTTQIGDSVTTVGGTASFTVSTPGTYYIKEIQAPAGYQLGTEVESVTVLVNSQAQDYPQLGNGTVTYKLVEPQPISVVNKLSTAGYTVEYYYDTADNEDWTLADTAKGTGNINGNIPYETDWSRLTSGNKPTGSYVLDKVLYGPADREIDITNGGNAVITDDERNNIVKVYFGINEIGEDQIPDRYQTTVTFNVSGGYWGVDGTDSAQKSKVVTLVDENGNRSDTGRYTLTEVDREAAYGSVGALPDATHRAGEDTDEFWSSTSSAVSWTATKNNRSFTYTYPTKILLTLTAVGYQGVYDGQRHNITVTAKDGEKEVPDAAVKYYADAGCVQELTEEAFHRAVTVTPENPEGVTVWAKVENAIYTSNVVSAQVKIMPKPLTVKATATDRVYAAGNTNVEVTVSALEGVVTVNGTPDDVSVAGLNNGKVMGTVSSADAGSGKPVTIAPLTLTGADAGNYTLTQPTVQVNIGGEVFYNANADGAVTGIPGTDSGSGAGYAPNTQAGVCGLGADRPVRANYTFLGWSENPNAAEAMYTADGDMVTMTGNGVTLYAIWSRDTYTVNVTYQLLNGSGEVEESDYQEDDVANAKKAIVSLPDSWRVAVGTSAGATITAPEKVCNNYVYDAAATAALNRLSGNAAGKNGTVNVTLVYALDVQGSEENGSETGDLFPDYQQAFVKFVSAAESQGTVTGRTYQTFNLSPSGDGYGGKVILASSTAVAGSACHFLKWEAASEQSGWSYDASALPAEIPSGTELTVTGGNTYVFTASFAETYTVIFDANGGVWETAPGGYALNETGSIARSQTPVESTGRVMPLEDSAVPAREHHRFLGWWITVDDKQEEYTAFLANVPANTAARLWRLTNGDPDNRTITLTAAWEAIPLSYTLVRHYLDASGGEVYRLTDTTRTAAAGTPVHDLVVGLTEPDQVYTNGYDGRNYYFRGLEVTDDLTALTADSIQIDLYYDVDSWSEKDPDSETGDGVPDKYQVLVRMVSAEPLAGAVSGAGTRQVFTLRDGADAYLEIGTVEPSLQEVTVSPAALYAFDKWTRDGGNMPVDPEAPLKAAGGTTIVFEAHFSKDEKGKSEGGEEKPDGIPDQYQAFVWYKAADNGTVTSNGDAYQAYDLREKNDDGSFKLDGNGNYTLRETIDTVGAAAQGDSGYAFDFWTYGTRSAEGTETAVALETAVKRASAMAGENGKQVEAGTTYLYTAFFDVDVRGGTEGGDGFPDKYQVKVTFKIDSATGLWNDGTSAEKSVYLKKYAPDTGDYAADGVAGLAAAEFPATGLLPEAGYTSAGRWISGGETVTVSDKTLSEDTEYSFAYIQKGGGMIVEATGYQAVYDGDWHEPITALRVLDSDGNDISTEVSIAYSTGGVLLDHGLDEVKNVADSKTIHVVVRHPDYQTVECDAVVKITPRNVVMTSADASKVYDGAALVNGSVTVNESGFVKDEGAEYTVTGTITGVGSVANGFTYVLRDTTLGENYNITKRVGTLTVTCRLLTVITPSASRNFNGLALTAGPAVVSGLANGETVTVTATGSQTAIGSSSNTYSIDWGSVDRNNYDVRESLGTLTVSAVGTPNLPPFVDGGGGTTTIPNTPTPMGPSPDETEIGDEDVPLAAPGLNSTDHFDYIKGYGDGTVRPDANIKRSEVATIFFRLMTGEFRSENWSAENDFTDVSATDWFNNAVSTAATAGILGGYPDGSFQPSREITRAEFAAIAARFASAVVPVGGMFSDIEGHWAQEDIERAAAAGWIQGSGGLFRPNDKITRAEAITLINRMLDRVPDGEFLLENMITFSDNLPDKWYYADVQEATNSHNYDRDEMGVTEIWTELLPAVDWTALEKEWATAATSVGADVGAGLNGGSEAGGEDEAQPEETAGDGEA